MIQYPLIKIKKSTSYVKKLPKLSKNNKKRLAEFLQYLKHEKMLFMGYPCSNVYDYSELNDLLKYSINNVGDPFYGSNYHLNTHHFEQEVIEYFKQITVANNKKVWGYVTSGGTEGNLYGLYVARNYIGNDAVIYYSQDSHYSIKKNINILNIEQNEVLSYSNGEINYDDLKQKIANNKNKKVIINANIGTTIKGAIDSVTKIKILLNELNISDYYIHADAAFFGMILPFLDKKIAFGFDTGINSIAISGHKMIGSPLPCGVVIVKEKYIKTIGSNIDYIGGLDNTITGSRNAISPMYLWYAIKTILRKDFAGIIRKCFVNADYAIVELNKLNLNAWRNKNSFIVVFDKIAPKLLSKWQIAVSDNIAHLIPMPHISKKQIDNFILEIKKYPNTNSKKKA